jgi:hypothetical protein
MKTTRCVICKCEKKVVGFKQDDPILECGHVLTVQDQEIDEIFSAIFTACDDLAQRYIDVGFDRDVADKFVTADVFGL